MRAFARCMSDRNKAMARWSNAAAIGAMEQVLTANKYRRRCERKRIFAKIVLPST